jgi:hypothetical protein
MIILSWTSFLVKRSETTEISVEICLGGGDDLSSGETVVICDCMFFLIPFIVLQGDQKNQAIAMISYYASPTEPAQVRGKNVYLQYSNRQEIVNNKATGEGSGNVLLVGMEGVAPDSVSIDVLHVVRMLTVASRFMLFRPTDFICRNTLMWRDCLLVTLKKV